MASSKLRYESRIYLRERGSPYEIRCVGWAYPIKGWLQKYVDYFAGGLNRQPSNTLVVSGKPEAPRSEAIDRVSLTLLKVRLVYMLPPALRTSRIPDSQLLKVQFL